MMLARGVGGKLSGVRVRGALHGGRRHAGSRVILYARPNPEELAAAFVAGRRVGGAVQRNRARRVLREAWRSLAPQIDRGADVVFVARRGILRATVAQLEEEMAELLGRSELIPR
jgi:ribonuclease P protein component